jgi:hypothetical protein
VEQLKAQNRRLKFSLAEHKDTEKYLRDIEQRLEQVQGDQGPISRTFFSAESEFPQKIPWNLLEKRIFKTFSAENSNLFQHFLEENFPRNFPQKNVQKIGPG